LDVRSEICARLYSLRTRGRKSLFSNFFDDDTTRHTSPSGPTMDRAVEEECAGHGESVDELRANRWCVPKAVIADQRMHAEIAIPLYGFAWLDDDLGGRVRTTDKMDHCAGNVWRCQYFALRTAAAHRKQQGYHQNNLTHGPS